MSLFPPQSGSVVGPETVSFDNSGHIVRFSPIRKFFLALVIVLTALLSFGIGRLSIEGEREPVKIEYSNESSLMISSGGAAKNQAASVANTLTDGQVYASVNGTRYYYSHCSSNVLEKNKVTFATPEEAQSAGYTLALNCKPK